MRLEDFYNDMVRIAPDYVWSVDEHGKIRGKKLIGEVWAARTIVVTPTTAHYEKCHDFGITEIQGELMKAEDDSKGCDPMIRAKLLEILGLIGK